MFFKFCLIETTELFFLFLYLFWCLVGAFSVYIFMVIGCVKPMTIKCLPLWYNNKTSCYTSCVNMYYKTITCVYCARFTVNINVCFCSINLH